MKTTALIAAAASTILFSGSLSAASLTNYDETSQTVIVTEEGQDSTITLEGNETVEEFCVSGCTIKFANGDEYNLAGNEIVAIEGSQIYVDQMDAAENEPDEEQPTETEEEGEPAPEDDSAGDEASE